MQTYRLITDQQIQDNLGDVLTSYEQYMRDFRQSVSCPNGWTVLPRIVKQPGETAMQLRERILASPCDYNDLMGDDIPFIVLHEYPFGHYPDAVPGDGLYFTPGTLTVDVDNVVISKPDADPFGAFGRIGPYNKQSTDTDKSMEEYRQWLTDEMNPLPWLYAPEVWIDDHFAYAPYDDIGNGARAQIPAGWTVKDLRTLVGVGDTNDMIDGEWAQLATRPVMVNFNLDGGFWNRLYNTGSAKDWRATNPGAYLEVIFGSEQDEFWNDDNLMVAATTTPYCNCCYCDWWGEEHMGLFFAGRPIGDVQRAPGYWAKKVYGTIQGSCTKMLLDPQLALLDQEKRLSAVEQKIPLMQTTIDDLKASGTGTGGGPGGGTGDGGGTGGSTVLAWNLGGPDVGAFKGISGTNWTAPTPASVAGVKDAAPAAVYQTGWTGAGFAFKSSQVPAGNYVALLHGAEPQFGSAGARVQTITVNDKAVTVDWFALAGASNKAVVISVPVTVGADGVLAVSGVPASSKMACWLCAVELRAATG